MLGRWAGGQGLPAFCVTVVCAMIRFDGCYRFVLKPGANLRSIEHDQSTVKARISQSRKDKVTYRSKVFHECTV